jgi:hypothetical protein
VNERDGERNRKISKVRKGRGLARVAARASVQRVGAPA